MEDTVADRLRLIYDRVDVIQGLYVAVEDQCITVMNKLGKTIETIGRSREEVGNDDWFVRFMAQLKIRELSERMFIITSDSGLAYIIDSVEEQCIVRRFEIRYNFTDEFRVFRCDGFQEIGYVIIGSTMCGLVNTDGDVVEYFRNEGGTTTLDNVKVMHNRERWIVFFRAAGLITAIVFKIGKAEQLGEFVIACDAGDIEVDGVLSRDMTLMRVDEHRDNLDDSINIIGDLVRYTRDTDSIELIYNRIGIVAHGIGITRTMLCGVHDSYKSMVNTVMVLGDSQIYYKVLLDRMVFSNMIWRAKSVHTARLDLYKTVSDRCILFPFCYQLTPESTKDILKSDIQKRRTNLANKYVSGTAIVDIVNRKVMHLYGRDLLNKYDSVLYGLANKDVSVVELPHTCLHRKCKDTGNGIYKLVKKKNGALEVLDNEGAVHNEFWESMDRV